MLSRKKIHLITFYYHLLLIITKQKYLKFSAPVILNLFQDLIHWTNRDAEPSSARQKWVSRC